MMIDLELAHFVAKFYLIGLSLCFICSYINRRKNKSNLIAVTFSLFHCIIDQFSKVKFDFYTFYLGAAFGCLVFILITVLVHVHLCIKHVKTTVIIYVIYFLIAISFLILHRIRVVIYSSDEPIMWLINLQSVFILTLYFLSVCIFVYGCKIPWNTQFGRFFSRF